MIFFLKRASQEFQIFHTFGVEILWLLLKMSTMFEKYRERNDSLWGSGKNQFFLNVSTKPLKTLKWRQSDSKTCSGLVFSLTRLQTADVLCVAVATATLELENNWKVLRSLQQSWRQTLITALRTSIKFWSWKLAPLNVFFLSIFFFSISVRSDFLT